MSMIELATRVQSLGLTWPALLVVLKATLILAIAPIVVVIGARGSRPSSTSRSGQLPDGGATVARILPSSPPGLARLRWWRRERP